MPKKKVRVTWEIGNRGKTVSQWMPQDTAKAFADIKAMQGKKVKVTW